MPDQPQPEIQQRIADLMQMHRFERHSESRSRDDYFAWWGHCTGCGFESDRHRHSIPGWELHMRRDEAHHVAEVLVSELGLTREWTFSWEIPKGSERRYGISCETREEAVAEGESYMDIVSRHFTEWVADA